MDREETALAEVIRGDFPSVEEHGGTLRLTSSIAALNLSPEPGGVGGNLRLAGRAIRKLCGRDPSLRWVVLPELFTCGYSDLGSVYRHAEDAEYGESARFFARLARELGIFVAYGFPESDPAARVFDSANLVGPGGVLATYRKRNLVETTLEYRVFAAGADLPVVEAGGLRVAPPAPWTPAYTWPAPTSWATTPRPASAPLATSTDPTARGSPVASAPRAPPAWTPAPPNSGGGSTGTPLPATAGSLASTKGRSV